jgi:hypothetical protein
VLTLGKIFIGMIIGVNIIYIYRVYNQKFFGFIDFSYNSTNKVLITFILISLILLILLQIYLLYVFTNKQEEPSKLFILIRKLLEMATTFRDLYQKMLDSFYVPFFRLKLFSYPLQKSFGIFNFILKYKPNEIKSIIRTYYYLPPCVISLTYLIEVVYNNCLTYFGYSIFLMVFPLIIRIYVYHLGLFCAEAKNFFDLAIVLKEDQKGNSHYNWTNNSFMPQHMMTDEILFQLAEYHQKYVYLQVLFNILIEFIYFLPERLIYYCFSLLCWIISFSYILYRMLI